MYRKYRMIKDLAIVNGGYIRETRIACGPLSKSYIGTARVGDLSAHIVVKFYHYGGSRIIGPATNKENDRHAYDDLM